MSITIEDIKAEHSKISAMIAAFEQQPKFPVTVKFPELNPGEKFVGVIISADGSSREYLILLPGEADPANWKTQMDWAKSIGGELPDRVESALLFATMKDEFKQEWYWTRERHVSASCYAWRQNFHDGTQNCILTLNRDRARAVRRLEIQ